MAGVSDDGGAADGHVDGPVGSHVGGPSGGPDGGAVGSHGGGTDPVYAVTVIIDHELVDPESAESGVAMEVLDVLAAGITDALDDAMARLGVPPGTDIGVMLSGEDALHRLNREHRGRDMTTDVLSFRSEDDPDDSVWLPEDSAGYLGDIAIAVPVAAEGAAEAGHSLIDEVRLLAVHGLLHLLGHDDATAEGAETMERLERELGVRRDDG